MNALVEYAKRVAVRRVVYLLFALALAAVSQCVHAQENPSKPEALAQCQAHLQTMDAAFQTVYHQTPTSKSCVDVAAQFAFECRAFLPSFGTKRCNEAGGQQWFYYDPNAQGCAAGEVPDPEHPGQCLDSQKCLARNVNILGDGVRAWDSKCISGCQIAMQPGGSSTTANGSTVYRGRFEYSGNVCIGGVVQNPNPDGTRTDEKTKPQECVPAGGGQTMCVKPNGDNCYTASSGKQICWKPGETGTKTDGPVAQQRKPGHVEAPPDILLPNGDTAAKTGNSVQTTTTTNTTTTNTTTTNYVSSSGADAGNDPSGEPDDGTGQPVEDGNQSAGGANCQQPPTSSGDPILGNILTQTYRTRCDAEKRDSDMRSDAATLSVASDAMEAEHPTSSIFKEGGGDGVSFDETRLGGGGASCPSFPAVEFAPGVVFTPPADFCSYVAMIRLLFLSVAYIWGLRIVAG